MTTIKILDAMAQVAAAFDNINGLQFITGNAGPSVGAIRVKGCTHVVNLRVTDSTRHYAPRSGEGVDQVLLTVRNAERGVYGYKDKTVRIPVGKNGKLNAESLRAAAYRMADLAVAAEKSEQVRADRALAAQIKQDETRVNLMGLGLMGNNLADRHSCYVFLRGGIEARVTINSDGNLGLTVGALSVAELKELLEVRS